MTFKAYCTHFRNKRLLPIIIRFIINKKITGQHRFRDKQKTMSSRIIVTLLNFLSVSYKYLMESLSVHHVAGCSIGNLTNWSLRYVIRLFIPFVNLIPFPLSHSFIFLISLLSFFLGKDGIFPVCQTMCKPRWNGSCFRCKVN